MEEMRIYIANLGKYNEGELVGAWFTPPVDFEEVKERIGLNDEYEEYAIHDYELPFEIDEYTPIEEVNRLCEMVEDLPEYIQEELSELPDKETSFEEYTTMELLSVAMLIVISTFALDFIHTDRSVFKIVDLDEAWSFLQVAQGKTLSMKLVRAGRAMNAGVYFVTQNTDDLLDEKLKNNLGLKFAFRSTDINEIKKTLAFFGVDSEDENNQKRLRDLENGQCLISDLYGRVGVIQFHPIFEDLFHAFDTRPPVRKEVE